MKRSKSPFTSSPLEKNLNNNGNQSPIMSSFRRPKFEFLYHEALIETCLIFFLGIYNKSIFYNSSFSVFVMVLRDNYYFFYKLNELHNSDLYYKFLYTAFTGNSMGSCSNPSSATYRTGGPGPIYLTSLYLSVLCKMGITIERLVLGSYKD